jgi:hypothetical protein
MISRPTVFIIGAGASAEFDMPAGDLLKSRIAAALRSMSPLDPEWLRKADGSTRVVLARALDRFPSIDEALHFHAGNEEVIRIGKLAIAHEIIKAERSSRLYGAIAGSSAMIAECNKAWAPHFLGLALSATKLADIKTLFANVTVIDFNYDRVLTEYLYWALQRDLGIPKQVAAECVSSLKVLRPYGCIGPLDWQDSSGTAFGGEATDLHSIANGIVTYTEEARSDDMRGIKTAISAAKTIVILGFGYHRQNIDLLRISGAVNPRTIFMTTYHIFDGNDDDLINAIQVCMQTQLPPRNYDRLAAEFMVRLRPSLVMATS